MTNVYKFKGSVASYANLPSSGLTAGDVYNVQDSEMNYAWTGTAWDQLGSSQINLQTITNAEIDTIVANATSGSGSSGGGGGSSNGSLVRYSYFTGTGTKSITINNPFGYKLSKIEIRSGFDCAATARGGYAECEFECLCDPTVVKDTTYYGVGKVREIHKMSTSGNDWVDINTHDCIVVVTSTYIKITILRWFAVSINNSGTTSERVGTSTLYDATSLSEVYRIDDRTRNPLNPYQRLVRVRLEGVSDASYYVADRTQTTATQGSGWGQL